MKKINLKKLLGLIWLTGLVLPLQANAQQDEIEKSTPSWVLINDVIIFNGHEKITEKYLLIKDNIIEKISNEEIDIEVQAGYQATDEVITIDGGNKLLMPGLIDAHWHTFMAEPPMDVLLTSDVSYLHTRAAVEATRTLMRGFTTVRDLGSPSFGLKQAIDEGILDGPRIYPSGAIISQTSGHGDFRLPTDRPRHFGGRMSYMEESGATLVVDGVPEVLTAVRTQLRKGASQIKLTAGGGVMSEYDPIDTAQFTFKELEAAVQAADDWGTYVTAHVYTDKAIKRALKAGVKCIDHGQMMTEKVFNKLIKSKAKHNIWLSTQPLLPIKDDPNPKRDVMRKNTEKLYTWIKKRGDKKGFNNINVAFGTDKLGGAANEQSEALALLLYKPEKEDGVVIPWFSSKEILTMAMYNNGRLLKLSGERNPYPEGLEGSKDPIEPNLGMIRIGAYADLLIMKNDPLEDGDVLKDFEDNLLLIMKDGKIVKNGIENRTIK